MKGDPSEALHCIRMARELAIWFHKSFSASPVTNLGAFVPPPDPKEAQEDLINELEELRKQLAKTEKTGIKEAEKRKIAEEKAKTLYYDLSVAISLAQETEEQLNADKQLYEEYISELSTQNARQPADLAKTKEKTHRADKKINLNETDTRRIIDQQLRDAGWEADTHMNYLGLREYQLAAIRAVERAISQGKQAIMLAMALPYLHRTSLNI